MKTKTNNFITAERARELSDKPDFSYLFEDGNVLSIISSDIEKMAKRGCRKINETIPGGFLTDKEMIFCKTILENNGFLNVSLVNFVNELRYSLEW